jgi:hypothetical protein
MQLAQLLSNKHAPPSSLISYLSPFTNEDNNIYEKKEESIQSSTQFEAMTDIDP